jgi:hypothetical protein
MIDPCSEGTFYNEIIDGPSLREKNVLPSPCFEPARSGKERTAERFSDFATARAADPPALLVEEVATRSCSALEPSGYAQGKAGREQHGKLPCNQVGLLISLEKRPVGLLSWLGTQDSAILHEWHVGC